MSMNETPTGERVHISLFGKRNAGKSSVMNALIGQKLSIVSPVKGTTTDPVRKTMELLPLGPVIFTDTPGLDDEGTLGEFRIEKSYQVLDQTDIAVVVIDGVVGKAKEDIQLIQRIREKKLPYVVVYNKQDLVAEQSAETEAEELSSLLEQQRAGQEVAIRVSTESMYHIQELKELLAAMKPALKPELPLLSDLVEAGETVILVVPIDKAAPKGRLILPQQQTIRELLDIGAIPVVTRETELMLTWKQLVKPPAMVVTDSQVFEEVAQMVPDTVRLTSFSILFARHKGVLKPAIEGAEKLRQLENKDTILIAEGCTHHRQCGDIGLSLYILVLQCCGCMLNEQDIRSRYRRAASQNVKMTNYGIAISEMKGILNRCIQCFPEIEGWNHE